MERHTYNIPTKEAVKKIVDASVRDHIPHQGYAF